MIKLTDVHDLKDQTKCSTDRTAHTEFRPSESQIISDIRESLQRDMHNHTLIRQVMLQSGIIDENGDVIQREMSGQR